MKLSTNSWHYWVYTASWGVPPHNLCPYFWKLVIATLFLPFNLIWHSISLIVNAVAKDDIIGERDWPFFSSRFMMSLALNVLLCVLIGMVAIWFAWNSFTRISGITGYGVLIIVLISLGIIKIQKRMSRRVREKRPNIIAEFVKAKYNKYCPTIEWEYKNDNDEEKI